LLSAAPKGSGLSHQKMEQWSTDLSPPDGADGDRTESHNVLSPFGAKRLLVDRFLRSAQKFPGRTALVVTGEAWSYRNLHDRMARIARAVIDSGCDRGGLVGVFANRSFTAYAGILGALMAGCGYVPLHPRFPLERTRRMCSLASLSTLVVGNEALVVLDQLLDGTSAPLTIIGPEVADFGTLPHRCRQHRFLSAADINALTGCLAPRRATLEDTAYLLFTSGSTGIPKGVPVSQRNVAAYLDHVADRYDIGPDDAISQTFDLTFDLSVHDLFVTWQAGAALFVVPERLLMAPAGFISAHALTVWFSVPSVAMMMSRLRQPRPAAFPRLRLVLFCGEALPVGSVVKWAEAAPNARIENLYGPTEATIAIAGYVWQGVESSPMCRRGVAPIGTLFPGQEGMLIGQDGEPVLRAGRGELFLAGSQVTSGYWRAPEKTAERYVVFADRPGVRWYRTGDIVERDETGCLHFIGRVDNQVKLNGHRIELQDVDAALRQASGVDLAVTVAWPIEDGRVMGLVGCIAAGTEADDATVMLRCAAILPSYMVPTRVHRVDKLPLNANGKIDRNALVKDLDWFATVSGAIDRRGACGPGGSDGKDPS
jgi:amino acid adenylation domain-containing protein